MFRNYDNPLLDRDYRLPIVHAFDFPRIKKTAFPTSAYEAGVINVSEPIDLKKSSVITKPEPEFYQKYYEVSIEHVKHRRPHNHKHRKFDEQKDITLLGHPYEKLDEQRDIAPLKQRKFES